MESGEEKETDPNLGRFLELTPLFSKKTDPNLGRFPERKNMNHDLAITGPETAASEPGVLSGRMGTEAFPHFLARLESAQESEKCVRPNSSLDCTPKLRHGN